MSKQAVSCTNPETQSLNGCWVPSDSGGGFHVHAVCAFIGGVSNPKKQQGVTANYICAGCSVPFMKTNGVKLKMGDTCTACLSCNEGKQSD